jgi:hypothetical protein
MRSGEIEGVADGEGPAADGERLAANGFTLDIDVPGGNTGVVMTAPGPCTTMGRVTWYVALPCGAFVSRSVIVVVITPGGWLLGTTPSTIPDVTLSVIHRVGGSVVMRTGLWVSPRRGAGKRKDSPGRMVTGATINGPALLVGTGTVLPRDGPGPAEDVNAVVVPVARGTTSMLILTV